MTEPISTATIRDLGARGPVLWFAVEMERQLQANDHKLGWESLPARRLLMRLRQEVDELARAIERHERPERLIAEAADVANFAMMIADNAGEKTSDEWRP